MAQEALRAARACTRPYICFSLRLVIPPTALRFTTRQRRIKMAALFESSNQSPEQTRMNNSRPRTLIDLLRGATAARPDEEVIRYKQDKQWTGLSGRALLDRVRHVALGLYDFGVRKG